MRLQWMMHDHAAGLAQRGFLVLNGLVPQQAVGRLREVCEPLFAGEVGRRPGVRRVLEREPRIVEVLRGTPVPALSREIAGPSCRVVRAILFDKSPGSNWMVPWHQDATIAVATRVDAPGFGPWSIKDGEHHCCPAREVLDAIVVVRVHLDPCGPENGPLRIVPKSDRQGLLGGGELERLAREGPVVECCTDAGGVVVIRPHTIHSSPRSVSPARRRVLHLEFASVELPRGMEWAEAQAL